MAFFAVLLTQINTMSELLGLDSRDAKDIKNGVLQFLNARNVSEELAHVSENEDFLYSKRGVL